MNSSDLALYAVTACGAPVSDAVEAQEGGATFLQLREKELSDREFLAKAIEIRKFARVPYVINDNVEIAAASGADGVHVGQGDAPLASARAALGPDKIVGVSCTTLQEAVEAEKGGADYLGVGAVFPTGTKLDADYVSASALRAITASVRIPVVAIGGIQSENIMQLGGSGIAGVAVVSALFGSGNVRKRTEAFAAQTRSMLNVPAVRRKGVLLDLDGLLLDSTGIWDKIDRTLLMRHDLFSEEHLAFLHDSGTIEHAAEYLQQHGLSLSMEQIRSEVLDLLMEEYHDRVQFLPGAMNFLQSLQKSGTAIALLTASPENLVLPALKRLHADHFFDRIFCEADKTLPDPFYTAAEALGTGIRDTVVYDDSGWVLDTARKAGFPCRNAMETYG